MYVNIVQVLTAPRFKHNRWFIDVSVSNGTKTSTTTIVGDTKLEVLEKSKIGNKVEVID